MKVYVIKNKDGKYLGVCSSDYSHYWTSIDSAHYFRYFPNHDPKQEAEDFKNRKYPDCEVVEITITEVDLEYQLAITEKALELASETIKQMCGKPLWIGGNMLPPEPKDSKYFKDIAKEMLENE